MQCARLPSPNMMHTELNVWKKSIALVSIIFEICEAMPNQHRYILCQQMQRAVISVPSNIAEGASRSSTKEFLRFLRIANSSLAELHTQLVITQELNIIPGYHLPFEEVRTIRKMLYRLKQSLERKL